MKKSSFIFGLFFVLFGFGLSNCMQHKPDLSSQIAQRVSVSISQTKAFLKRIEKHSYGLDLESDFMRETRGLFSVAIEILEKMHYDLLNCNCEAEARLDSFSIKYFRLMRSVRDTHEMFRARYPEEWYYSIV